MKAERVKSISHLRKLVERGVTDYVLALGGCLQSSKHIIPADTSAPDAPPRFIITNLIDDSEQVLTADELNDASKTNIGAAIKCGAFFAEAY